MRLCIINWCRTNSQLKLTWHIQYSAFKIYRAISEDSSFLECDWVCCNINSSQNFKESYRLNLSGSSSPDGLDRMTVQMKELWFFETPGTIAQRCRFFLEHLNLLQQCYENLKSLYISLVPTNAHLFWSFFTRITAKDFLMVRGYAFHSHIWKDNSLAACSSHSILEPIP